MGLTDIETIPETGAVFTIGRSRFADNVASHFFIRKDPVISIACGDEHSAVICQSGRLFVFGSNGWGQLGLGHKNHVSKPSCVKILKPEKVTHVACGRAHTLICTGGQKIFACGSDQEGQLGRGSSTIGDSASSPVRVYDCGLAGPRVLEIAAGSHHSLALTSDGGVVAWGSNLEGQLGLSGVSGLVNKPTKVPIPEPVKQISAGYYHSAFLTESGLVYVCGESESGKLGIDVNFSTQVAPKQMQLPSPAVQVTCGGHHTFILAENGNLYCTGSNSSGQLGLGTNVTEIQTPKLLPRGALQNETVARIACGESHSAVVTDSGKLFTCGDGRHGKLGLEENENNVQELTFAPKYQDLCVSNVACGGCHTILVAHRRETRNGQAQGESESMQMDQIQKRNSLPPLKVPVSRLQSETNGETTNEKEKPESGDEKDRETATPIENIAKTKEDIADNTTEHTEHGVAETMNEKKDSMNNIKDVESSEKSVKDASEETRSASASTKAKEATTVNGSKEEKNDNEKSETEVDSENNVREEERKNDRVNHEDHNKATNLHDTNENNTENSIETSNDRDDKTSQENGKDITTENNMNAGNNEDDRVNATIKEAEPKDDADKDKSPEKRVISLNSTPPPKPPRLKPSSANSSSSPERVSSAKTEKEIASTEDNTTAQKHPDVVESARSTGSATNSGGSKSTKSIGRDDAEDTIEIDKGKDEADGKGRGKEEEKAVTDGAPDDADVVQSPPPRTGRMSKMFKAKKQQEIENGTKAIGTVNHKAKSKTCTLL